MKFAILGPLELVGDDGRPATRPQARSRSLLAALLLHANRPVSAAQLMELTWGHEQPHIRPGNVRTQVYVLRKKHGLDDRLRHDDRGYRLTVLPGELDAAEFSELTAGGLAALERGEFHTAAVILSGALRLWREPPLADIPATLAMARIRERLHNQHRAAGNAMVAARLALGQHHEVLPWTAEHTAEYPTDERGWVLAMTALYRCGRRAEALDAYRRARTVLADEYGIDPGPDLRRLHRQMLRDEPLPTVNISGAALRPAR